LLKKLNKYLALFLLAVFSFAILPTHTLHDWFADHEDTEHNFCEKHLTHFGSQVEKTHTHCEILKTNTPVYDHPSLLVFKSIQVVVVSEIYTAYKPFLPSQILLNISGRGPPNVA
jgi:hypothetical protein